MFSKQKLFFLICIWNVQSTLYAMVIKGNSTTPPFGFTVPITTTAYNTFIGNFFVGLAGSGDVFNISMAIRPNFLSTPQFSSVLAPTSNLKNNSVEFLALQNLMATTPTLGVVELAGTTPFTTNILSALRTNGSQETTSGVLNDATGIPSEGITNVVSGGTNFFAAVRPNSGNFGDTGSGISLIGVGDTNILTLNVRNAATGLPGNQAIALDHTSIQLTGGTSSVTFQTGDALNITPMYYDTTLARLYLGTQISTGTTTGDIAKSVVVGEITQLPADALALNPIAPNSTIDNTQQEIIVTSNNGSGVRSLSAIKLSVLHASTGPTYLIVYGGTDTFDLTTDTIWALPLVDLPSQPTIQGTLANKNSALLQGKFVTPALAPGDLANQTDSAAIVGAQPLALLPGQQINQLTAQDDTVYISINLAPSATNETGLFFSQALFGPDGKVIRWTPWKRSLAFDAFPTTPLPGDTTYNGAVAGFAVDNKTGNITFVEGTTDEVVGTTSFTQGVVNSDLASQLNQQLCTGAYSVLDLDQATMGFLSTTSSRYALFGGTNKVIITQTSKAVDAALPNSPQFPISDYSNPANFLITKLPKPGGSVTALEYSRTDGTDNNYFFAGTENGLYVYAMQTGQGFDISQFGDLNMPPFITAQWIKINSIPGAIIDIKTTGNGNLYIINSTTLTGSPFFQNTVFSIPFQSSVQTMFDPTNINIIAQTQKEIFADTLSFTGIQLVATNQVNGPSPASKEQLILSTSLGVYASHATQNPGNGITNATNESLANWQLVTASQNIFFNGIAGINTPIRQTVFPFGLIDDPRQCNLFDHGILDQLSADGNIEGTMAEIGTFIPTSFISQTNTIMLPPITYFYTDGSRRYFIFKPIQDPSTINSLGILPYNNAQFNMNSATILTPLSFNTRHYYWMSLIGDTGYLLAGTGNGVLALY